MNDIIERYLATFKQYTVFTGRARRQEYWTFTLCNIVISVLISVIIGFISSTLASTVSLIFSLAVLLPGIAVSIRRLHDTKRSGWWLLIAFIPLVGAIVLLIFMLQDSDGENQYGPSPKG